MPDRNGIARGRDTRARQLNELEAAAAEPNVETFVMGAWPDTAGAAPFSTLQQVDGKLAWVPRAKSPVVFQAEERLFDVELSYYWVYDADNMNAAPEMWASSMTYDRAALNDWLYGLPDGIYVVSSGVTTRNMQPFFYPDETLDAEGEYMTTFAGGYYWTSALFSLRDIGRHTWSPSYSLQVLEDDGNVPYEVGVWTTQHMLKVVVVPQVLFTPDGAPTYAI